MSLAAAWLCVALATPPADAQTAILFHEGFDDALLEARGWYDNVDPIITTEEHAPGSRGAVAFTFPQGATTPTSGGAMRIGFAETDTVYVSFWVKYSANWEGSNQPYHPHEIYLLTNLEDAWAPPAHGHLTVYIEQNEGEPLLAIQDGANIDPSRLGEDLSQTEDRAVAGCNGENGDGGEATCYAFGGEHRNGRFWRAGGVYFGDTPGPRFRGDWHHVEVLVRLNSIQEGRAAHDGVLRYWLDGTLLIERDNAVLRTGRHPEMAFNQLLIGPYIGDGSPVEQTFWLDELLIATGRVESGLVAGPTGAVSGALTP